MSADFNLYGPIGDLGYGIYTRGVIKGLISNGFFDFHISPVGQIQIEDRIEGQSIAQQSKEVLWNRNAPSMAVWHEFDLGKFSDNKMIAHPIFETTKFNPQAINYLSQMDAIVAPSKWAKDVIEANIGDGITPVHIIPGAAESVEMETQRNAAAFTFLTIGKLEVRKSHLETMQAYIQAFADTDTDTRLICHCHNPFTKNFTANIVSIFNQLGLEVVNYATTTGSIVGRKGAAFIEVPKARIPKEQIFRLYNYAHVGVFPSKGEGWNLPLMEAIKSGLPCIATNYSAHTEYLTREYGYPQDLLLNDYEMITANDGLYFHGDRGEWAAVKVDDLADKMLFAYNNYSDICEEFASEKVSESFTWKKTGTELIKLINSL